MFDPSHAGHGDVVRAPLDLTLCLDDEVVIIEIDGEVDHQTCEILRRVIDGVLATGIDSLVLDCSALTFLDSGGIGVLGELLRDTDARDGTVTVRNASALTRRLLAVTGYEARVAIT
ncbi:MAG: metal transporter substrate-binding protein [Acidimicrobiales bacterium]|nr:metal transporter substrate-binding protein [Acidimicrobiales bacterium]